MEEGQLVLIDSSVLPEVFLRTLEAKRLLTSGEAKNSSEAARMAGISRSAFYKYKDSVYRYSQEMPGQMITIVARLNDRPGVLSHLITELYRVGANILTVNQNIPVDGIALVSISVRIENITLELDELFHALRKIDGIETIERILGHS